MIKPYKCVFWTWMPQGKQEMMDRVRQWAINDNCYKTLFHL